MLLQNNKSKTKQTTKTNKQKKKQKMPPKIRSREEEEQHQQVGSEAPHNDAVAKAPTSSSASSALKMKAAPHLSPRLAAQPPKPAADHHPHNHNGSKQLFSLDDSASTTSTNNILTSTAKINNNSSKFSPPANINAPTGTAFPSLPSPPNDHHHHNSLHSEPTNVKTLHQIHLTKASPERDPSPRNSNGHTQQQQKLSGGSGSNNNSKLPSRGASAPGGGEHMGSKNASSSVADHQQKVSARDHFVNKVAEKLAKVLAISKLPPTSPLVPTQTKQSPLLQASASPRLKPSDIHIPSEEKLRELGKIIAEKLADKGLDYAKKHYADLCISLENEDNELLRNKIRNGELTPENVSELTTNDLLSRAEKKLMKQDEEESFKSHNMKDITRAVASIEKTIPCPSCGEKEAAVLESANDGGIPRFWSGGELEEGQQVTLYKCLNCDSEFSKESKY